MNVQTVKREFEKTIRGLAYRHHLWRVFSDFCEMAAISLGNVFLQDPKEEEKYKTLMSAYTEDERKEFPRLLSFVVSGLEDLTCDFLGEMFMGLELSSHWHGQFFTPMSLCKMIGKLQVAKNIRPVAEEKGFVTILEPACGAGAMILGLADAMRDEGLNYQQQIHVTCIDVDQTAANMCFIQLSLHHIPAVVYTGNTLSLEMQSSRRTLAHYLGGWDWRLREHKREAHEPAIIRPDVELKSTAPQISLFEAA